MCPAFICVYRPVGRFKDMLGPSLGLGMDLGL